MIRTIWYKIGMVLTIVSMPHGHRDHALHQQQVTWMTWNAVYQGSLQR
jgi:hypothetical protein